VPLNARKILIGVPIAGVLAAVLFPFAIYFIGLAVAPPLPVPAQSPVPRLIGQAIWARANGGNATALTPISPISMARFLSCVAIEDFLDTTPGDAQRVVACKQHMPAMQGVEYLSTMQMRDADLKPSFREGLGRLGTTVWLTRSWTKDEILNTLAERGEFGAGYRGVEAAAQGYFGRRAGELTLPQAALLVSFIGDRTTAFDPWCERAAATKMRTRILELMHEDLTIDDAAFNAADASDLSLGPPPPAHKRCSN